MECTLYLTDDCNLECKYCYEGERKNKSYMTEDTLKAAFAFITKYNIPDDNIDLVLLGGEPLMNKPVLYRIIEIIKEEYKEIKNLFRLQITTNGVLLDSGTANFLQKNNVAISISIDGNHETHSLNRRSKSGKDVYDVIMKNMYYMLENDVDFAVRMTVTANNVHLLYKNISFLYDMGIRKINIGLDECGPWKDEHFQEFDRQMSLVDEFYMNNIAENMDAILNIHDYKLSTFVFKRTPKYCSAGSSNHLVINSKGEIFPCGYVTNNKIWNIGNVYTKFERTKFLQTVRCNVKKCSSCKDCEIAFTCCGAKCGFMNYEKTGYLNVHHESTCNLQKVLYLHNNHVIKKMYQQYNPKLMKFIELAFKNKIPLSDSMLKIMESVERDREVV